jgi:hypothetical protein
MSTAFFWRHNILASLLANDLDYLSGIVEADETMFLESHKGTKNIDFRKPLKRGGKAKKRGLSDLLGGYPRWDRPQGGILLRCSHKFQIVCQG